MKKKLALAAAAVAVAGGGAAVSLTAAGAQTSTTTVPSASARANHPSRGTMLRKALDPLVKDGTLSQAQEDKVIAALDANSPMGAPGRRGFGFGSAASSTVVAQALGITTDQLRADLASGQSIAAIATAQKVDVSKVIAAIVDNENSLLGSAVTSGRLTQAQADRMKANETQRVTNEVNRTFPVGGRFAMGSSGWRNGQGGSGPTTTTTAPATTTTA